MLLKIFWLLLATFCLVDSRSEVPLEFHLVTTPDGYILNIFRLPNPGKEAVLLQHGQLSSHKDWLVIGPEKSLAHLLFNAGYDVWLGNARGNTFSRRHTHLSPSSQEFWDFSWHEIGQIDLPAMIDYILLNTNQSALHYVGHSQGTTAFWVMGALRKDMNKKIKSMNALGPAAYMGNLYSPFLRVTAIYAASAEWVAQMLGYYEFSPSDSMMVQGGKLVCLQNAIYTEMCTNSLFLFAGYNSRQFNRSLLPEIMENTPAGSSVKQVLHYSQLINSAKFRMYDYGFAKNLVKYGQMTPPEYDLSSVTAPVYLHYSDNDWLCAVKDVEKLGRQLGNLKGMYKVPDPYFNHLDFIWAIDVKFLVYDRVIEIIKRNSDL